MKKIESFLLRSCGYTVFILIVFYIMQAILGVKGGISTGRFFLILAFGFVISLTGSICSLLKLHLVFSGLVHYAISLISFCVMFMLIDPILAVDTPAKIFLDIAIFTVFFIIIAPVLFFINLAISAADKKISEKAPAQKNTFAKNSKGEKKSAYTPLFSDNAQNSKKSKK